VNECTFGLKLSIAALSLACAIVGTNVVYSDYWVGVAMCVGGLALCCCLILSSLFQVLKDINQ
jgi:hypothetical protein